MRELSDFSNHPEDFYLDNNHNKLVTLKLRDGFGSEPIKEFGQKLKLFSVLSYRKKTAAMVLKKIAQNEPTQDQFKKVLTKSQAFPTINTQIRYSRSKLRKLNLYCFGFELFRLEDGILSQRFGQYKCRDVGFLRQTVGDSEWSEDDQPCSQHMERIKITWLGSTQPTTW